MAPFALVLLLVRGLQASSSATLPRFANGTGVHASFDDPCNAADPGMRRNVSSRYVADLRGLTDGDVFQAGTLFHGIVRRS